MGKQDVEKKGAGLLAILLVVVMEDVVEAMGDVDGHCRHPEEEGDPGVLHDVAEHLAACKPNCRPIVVEVEGVTDTVEEEGYEQVDQESNGKFAKKLGPVLLHEAIDNQGRQDEH